MAVTGIPYNTFKQKLITNADAVAYVTDTVKVALLTSAYTPNFDTHDFFNDVSAAEVVGTGYTAGGVALASKTTAIDTGADFAYADADDPTWTTATLTARYAVVYKDTGSAATSPLMFLIDFGSDRSPVATDFRLIVAAAAAGALLKVA